MSSQRDLTCPDETTLAALVDGTLPNPARSAAAAHVVRCGPCFDSVAMLARLADSSVDSVDATIRERARLAGAVTLGGPPARELLPSNWRVPAAAAVLLTLASGGLLYQVRAPADVGGPVSVTRHDVRITDLPDRVVVRHPGNDDVLAGIAAWDAVTSAIGYVVSVTDEDGALRWQVTVRATTARVSAMLEPGRRYYLMVKALLPDGKSIPGRAVRFRAPPR